MFCLNCGAEIPNGSKFCPKCGGQLNNVKEQQSNVSPDSVRMNQKSTQAQAEQVIGGSEGTSVRKNTSRIIAIIVAAVVVIAVIVIIIASNSRPTIDMNKYLTVYDSGYNGYGSVDYDIDYMQLSADYGGKLKLTSEGNNNYVMGSAVARGEDPVELIYDDVSIHPDVSSNLSNGDKVTFTWDTSEINMLETYIKVSIKTKDYVYTVSNLEETESEDFFNYVSVDFSGIAPEGTAELSVNCEWLSPYNFLLDKSEGLSNGDTVTVSINDYALESILSESGKAPVETKKKYTVEGLDEYVTALSQIPDDDLEKIRETGEEKINAVFDDPDSTSVANEITFLGYDMIDNESTYNTGNKIYAVYKINQTLTRNDESLTFDHYFYYCFTGGLISEDGTFYIDLDNYSVPEITETDLSTGKVKSGEGFTLTVGGHKYNFSGFESLEDLNESIGANSELLLDSTVQE